MTTAETKPCRDCGKQFNISHRRLGCVRCLDCRGKAREPKAKKWTSVECCKCGTAYTTLKCPTCGF